MSDQILQRFSFRGAEQNTLQAHLHGVDATDFVCCLDSMNTVQRLK